MSSKDKAAVKSHPVIGTCTYTCGVCGSDMAAIIKRRDFKEPIVETGPGGAKIPTVVLMCGTCGIECQGFSVYYDAPIIEPDEDSAPGASSDLPPAAA